jgi:hypothetical protein
MKQGGRVSGVPSFYGGDSKTRLAMGLRGRTATPLTWAMTSLQIVEPHNMVRGCQQRGLENCY